MVAKTKTHEENITCQFEDGELVILSRTLADLQAGSIGRVRILHANPPEVCVEFCDDGRLHLRRVINKKVHFVADYCLPIAEDDPRVQGLVLPFSNEQISASVDAIWASGMFHTYLEGVEAYHQLLNHFGSLFMGEEQLVKMKKDLRDARLIADNDYEKFVQACTWVKEHGVSPEFWTFYQSLGIDATIGSPFYVIGTRIGAIPPTPTNKS